MPPGAHQPMPCKIAPRLQATGRCAFDTKAQEGGQKMNSSMIGLLVGKTESNRDLKRLSPNCPPTAGNDMLRQTGIEPVRKRPVTDTKALKTKFVQRLFALRCERQFGWVKRRRDEGAILLQYPQLSGYFPIDTVKRFEPAAQDSANGRDRISAGICPPRNISPRKTNACNAAAHRRRSGATLTAHLQWLPV